MRDAPSKTQNISNLLLHGTFQFINWFDIVSFEPHNNSVEVGRVDTIPIN